MDDSINTFDVDIISFQNNNYDVWKGIYNTQTNQLSVSGLETSKSKPISRSKLFDNYEALFNELGNVTVRTPQQENQLQLMSAGFKTEFDSGESRTLSSHLDAETYYRLDKFQKELESKSYRRETKSSVANYLIKKGLEKIEKHDE